MGKRITKLSWAWLTTAALTVPVLTAAAHAGDNGTAFKFVEAGDCAKKRAEEVCIGEPLIQGSTVTALDVLRDIYPGLGPDGQGNRFAGAEAIEAASDPDAGEPADRAISISNGTLAEIAVIESGELAYAAAVSSGVVAVAQIRPDYKPLGRLLVATDPGGLTGGYRLLLAAPASPVVVTDSSHFNSEEGFDSLQLAGVIGGELVDLYEGPYLYSLTQATEHCQTLEHRESITSFETRKQSHHGLADIGIGIEYTATCVNGEKRKPAGKKSFPLRLAYDGARYDGNSSAIDDFNSSFTE
ncbi:hypothetical protein [Pleomorphomonas oryzae]|uniref:hypothetical protein n=1 Tax=Pleomorphomonas oryzae TaxID=261934 RepID=UPI00047B4DB9|nr:hypothetical protein [Pleomorphomonas oryzae]